MQLLDSANTFLNDQTYDFHLVDNNEIAECLDWLMCSIHVRGSAW